MVSTLVDFLHHNPLIAYLCGFDPLNSLPSYWTFWHFLKTFDHIILSSVMKSLVLFLVKKGIIDSSFIGFDSTPIAANTSHNNPKSFLANKFKPDHPPKADTDCKLGVYTASNQANEKKYQFYWGYKNHVLVDCISGLLINEKTTTAEVPDSTIAPGFFADTHSFLPITKCTFPADKGYDTKEIYQQVKEFYQGECIIPLNKRNTKNPKLLPQGIPSARLVLRCGRRVNFLIMAVPARNSVAH